MNYLSLSMIISSSVLILMIAVLRRLLRGKISRSVQYALWLLVAVRLLLPLEIGSVDFSVNSVAAAQTVERRLEQISVPVRPYQALSAEQYSRETGVPAEQIRDNELAAAARRKQSVPLTDLLFWLWLAGAAALFLWQALVNLRFARRLGREAAPCPDLEAKVPVYQAAWLSSPCLFGLLRPCIYLNRPETGERLRHILIHEQCHYAHGDHWWALVRALCLSLHWFNPLVWWAAALVRRDAELACDEAAVRMLGEENRRAYGETLLTLVSRR